MLSPTFAALTALLSVVHVLAAPHPRAQPPSTIELVRVQKEVPDPRRVLLENRLLFAHGAARTKIEAKLNALSSGGGGLSERDGSPTSVNATNWGAQYAVPVSFGTPAQTFDFIFDTGSADLWVWGAPPTCSSAQCQALPGYDPSKSSTAAKADAPRALTVQYGDGSTAFGNYTRDVVGLGDISFPYDFGLANSVDIVGFSGTKLAGIIGATRISVKPGSIAIDPENSPWWVQANKNGLLAEDVIGVEIAPADVNAKDTLRSYGGKLTIGGIDQNAIGEDLHWVDVSTGGPREELFWMAQLDGLSHKESNTTTTINLPVLTDTGTTGVYLRKSLTDAVVLKIPGAKDERGGYYSVPCDTTQSIALIFGGKEFLIRPKDFVGSKLKGNNRCQSQVSYLADDESATDAGIVGDVFFHSIYTAYKLNPPQIGFAKVKGA